MNYNYNFTCPECQVELSAEVDLREPSVDFETACDCGYKFTAEEQFRIYNEALIDCQGTAIDRAHDYLKD